MALYAGKRCSKCKMYRPYEDFSRNKTTKDGYQYQCKECKSNTDQDYRENVSLESAKMERALLEVQWYRIKAPQLRDDLIASLGPDPYFDQRPTRSEGMSTEDILAALANHMPKASAEGQD